MIQNGDGSPKDETDILSAIRRIVDEEQGDGPALAAGGQGQGQGQGQGAADAAPAEQRPALVLTPTMRVNARPGDVDLGEAAPLILTNRVDAAAAAAPAMDPAPDDAAGARDLRAAFGREAPEAPQESLRLTTQDDPAPASAQDEEAAMAARLAAQADAADAAEAEAAETPAPAAETPGHQAYSGFAGDAPAAAPAAAPTPEPASAPEPFNLADPAETTGIAPVLGELASMSRAELEAIVTEQLRKDLSGELGARISANIRSLVQREVEKAVREATEGR